MRAPAVITLNVTQKSYNCWFRHSRSCYVSVLPAKLHKMDVLRMDETEMVPTRITVRVIEQPIIQERMVRFVREPLELEKRT